MVESGHTVQLCLERNSNLTLHLLGGPAGVLRDDLDSGRRRVGVSFNVEQLESVETADQQDDRKKNDEQLLSQNKINQLT